MENLPNLLTEAIVLGVVLILCSIAIRVKNRFLARLEARHREHLDRFTLEGLSKVLTVVIVLIGLMIGLRAFGVDIVPLLTLSGIGAAVIGFASKDVIANFFGGSMIYVTRPFLVGDYIEIPSRKIAGTVEEIGWYLTTIRDVQKKTIYLPNSIFSTELLLNHSRLTHRRIEEKLRFRLTDGEEVRGVVRKIRALMEKHPEIDHNQPVEVFLVSVGPYGAEVELKGYTKTTDNEKFMAIKEELLLQSYAMVPPPKQYSPS